MVNQVAIGKVSIVGPMLPIDKIWLCCEFHYALFFFLRQVPCYPELHVETSIYGMWGLC